MKISSMFLALVLAISAIFSSLCFGANTSITFQDTDGDILVGAEIVILRRGTNAVYTYGYTNDVGVVTFDLPANLELDAVLNQRHKGFFQPTRLHVRVGQNMYYPFPEQQTVRLSRLGKPLTNAQVQCVYDDGAGWLASSEEYTDTDGMKTFSPPLSATHIAFTSDATDSESWVMNLEEQRSPDPIELIDVVVGLPQLSYPTLHSNGAVAFSWMDIPDVADFSGYLLTIISPTTGYKAIFDTGKTTSHIVSGFAPGDHFGFIVSAVHSSGYEMAWNAAGWFKYVDGTQSRDGIGEIRAVDLGKPVRIKTGKKGIVMCKQHRN